MHHRMSQAEPGQPGLKAKVIRSQRQPLLAITSIVYKVAATEVRCGIELSPFSVAS